jgi:hypothetical protein
MILMLNQRKYIDKPNRIDSYWIYYCVYNDMIKRDHCFKFKWIKYKNRKMNKGMRRFEMKAIWSIYSDK